MEKVYYYIYKITILRGRLKDHYYIGQHMTDNLNDGYLGSGRKIKDWFKYKNRIEGIDYIKEILCFCKDWEEMQEMEDFYLGDKWKDEYPECLNLREGGQQTRMCKESLIKRSKSIKETLSNRTEEEWETIKSNIHEVWTPEKCDEHSKLLTKAYEEHPEYHQHLSESGKKSYINNPERNKVQSDNAIKMWEREGFRDFMSENMYHYDKEHPERAQKISNTMIGMNKHKIYVNNGEESHLVTKEVAIYYISIGWKFGCLLKEVQTGSIYMTSNNDNHVYQVIPRKQQEFYNKGYYRCHRNGTLW